MAHGRPPWATWRGEPARGTSTTAPTPAAAAAAHSPAWRNQAVIALVVAFGLSLAPDQIGAILAVTAVILGLITRSRVSPVSTTTQ